MANELDTTAPEIERQDTTPTPADSDARHRSDETPDEFDAAEEFYGGGEVPAEPPKAAEPSPRAPQVEARAEAKPQVDADHVRTEIALEYEAKALERDLRDFGIAQQKLAEMQQTDPARAKAYAVTIKAAENELRERYQTLESAAQSVAQSQWTRRVEVERERLHQAVPELAQPETKAELKQYLTRDLGFTDQDLASPTAMDHRLVRMAWESQQYRKMKAARAKKTPAKMPVPPSKRTAPKRPADPLSKMYRNDGQPFFKMPKRDTSELDVLYGKDSKR